MKKETFETIIGNPETKKEYERLFLLCIFRKICSKMEKNADYDRSIRKLYVQSYDETQTAKMISERLSNIELDENESNLMNTWLKAHLNKQSIRQKIPESIKKQLYCSQKGICSLCGEPLGNDWSKIHVDHIIPWKLVGDELDDNFQLLCPTCNECKGSKLEYTFNKLLNLTT